MNAKKEKPSTLIGRGFPFLLNILIPLYNYAHML